MSRDSVESEARAPGPNWVKWTSSTRQASTTTMCRLSALSWGSGLLWTPGKHWCTTTTSNQQLIKAATLPPAATGGMLLDKWLACDKALQRHMIACWLVGETATARALYVGDLTTAPPAHAYDRGWGSGQNPGITSVTMLPGCLQYLPLYWAPRSNARANTAKTRLCWIYYITLIAV